MDAVTRETWERFYDRVVVRGRQWPRNLWFAAVEDGLDAALPARSRLLVQYRQDVAEFRELERAGTGSPRDATRMAQLEAEIMRLIRVADQLIREESADQQPEPALRPRAPGHARTGPWLGALTLVVVMFCGALLGATYYQQQRAAERMQLEFVALQQRLIEQAADHRSTLEARIRSVEGVKENLGALQAELRANVDEFNELMSTSLRSLSALGDSAIADLERRLLGQDSEAGAAVNGALERATTLEQKLDQVDDSLSGLAQRLPELDGSMSRVAKRLEAATAGLERVEGQVAKIQAQAPEIALWLEGQRQALAQDLEAQRQAIDALGAEITTLQDAFEDSRGQLVVFESTLGGDLALAKPQADGRARAAEPQALGSQVDVRFGPQADALQEIDALLAELGEQADLALRSQEAIKQTGAEAARRLDTVTAEAIAALGEAQEARLAELSKWASATEAELEQTRAGLVAGWHGMDAAVAARQAKVLAKLDQSAAILEGRVQEFLKALDVIIARSDG